MKTEQQILDRIKELDNSKDKDPFGFQQYDLIRFLPYEKIKGFISEDATEEGWEEHSLPLTRDAVLNEIKDYMEFAWEKANRQRGLSSTRNIEHMLAWTWILNDGVFSKLESSYENDLQYYGKPQLVFVCEQYGIDWKGYDDGEWANSEYQSPITADQALKKMRVIW